MSAKIIEFPQTTDRLQLEEYTLIAWRFDFGCDTDFDCLWKPNGPGWYQRGFLIESGSGELTYFRVSRSLAIQAWRLQFPYGSASQWHHLCAFAEAFPEKRRMYLHVPAEARQRERGPRLPW